MNLVQLRRKAVEISGRYDLVVNTSLWADNGMDFFIQEGQKFLERRISNIQNVAKIFKKLTPTLYQDVYEVDLGGANGGTFDMGPTGSFITGITYDVTEGDLTSALEVKYGVGLVVAEGAAGEFVLTFDRLAGSVDIDVDFDDLTNATDPSLTQVETYNVPYDSYGWTFQYGCRSIREVWINDGSARYELPSVSLKEFKEVWNSTTSVGGAPVCYTLIDLRALKSDDKDSLGTFLNITFEATDKKYDYRGIMVAPPVNKEYVVEVTGLFEHTILTGDSDENWWTIKAPSILLKAALYQLEVFSRGTENAKNWLEKIDIELLGLEQDFVDEESFDAVQMEG